MMTEPPLKLSLESLLPKKVMDPPIVCPGHHRPLAEVSFSEETVDGIFLISACLDGSPMLRDGETGDWIGTFSGHKGAVWSAKLCREARLAATGSGDFTARLWDAVTGSCLGVLEHKHIVKSVDISPDRRHAATAGHEGLVRIFDVETTSSEQNEPIMTFKGDFEAKKHQLNKVCWMPNGLHGENQIVACGGADGKVRVWDLRAPTKAAILMETTQNDTGPVMDLEIKSINNVGVMTVASGASVKFWNAQRFNEPARSEPLSTPVHFREEGGASLSPDGTTVVLGGGRHGGSFQGALGVAKGATRVGDVGSDLQVWVMDFDTGKVIEERKGHCGPVRCVRFNNSATNFATGSEDGTVRLWDATSTVAQKTDDDEDTAAPPEKK